MKILLLTSKPIFPIVDGGCRASHNFLQLLLSGGHNVKNITVSTNKHPFIKEAYPQDLFNKIQTVNVFIDTSFKVQNALLALIKGISYNFERFNDQKWNDLVMNEISINHFDVIILDGLYSSGPLPHLIEKYRGKIFIRAHNVEYKIWSQLSEHSRNPLKKWYYKILSKQLIRIEQKVYSSVEGIITITSEDEKTILNEFSVKQAFTIPFTQPEVNPKKDYSCCNIFHLGSMNWEPNSEAVRVLINDIYPKVKKSLPSIKIKIAGSNMDVNKIDDPENGVIAVGFIEDLEKWYQSEGIFVSPIQSGSGVRIKILEALNYGIPVITTRKGASGIPDEGQMLIVESNDEIVEKVIALSTNESLRKELGQKATQFIQDHYSVEQTSNRLNTFLNGG